MEKSRRERLRENTLEEIKDVARQQMAADGTSALSLRAIATKMGMTAPAIYRYYPSRDDLITALIVDAFNALADAVTEAEAQVAPAAYTNRLLAALGAYRSWALAHPTDFQLIYGNPIPGYSAPNDITVPAVVRTFTVIVRVIEEAIQAGALTPLPEHKNLPPTIDRYLTDLIVRDAYHIQVASMYIGMVGWTRIHGIIMLELYGHLGPSIGDVDALYKFELKSLCRQLGMPPPG